MNLILTYLNRPTFYNTKPWIGVICGSLLVFLLLITLEPYSIKTLHGATKYYKIAGFTLITAASCTIVGYLFPALFKKRYHSSTWTIGKDLINHALIILFVTLGNFSLNYILGHRITSETGLLDLLFHLFLTLVIGIIAGTITHFIVHNYALKRNLHDIEVINNRLKKHLQGKTLLEDNREIHSVDLLKNTKESISIDPRTILYIESSANYVKIDYLIGNNVKQIQLRATLNQIEKDLQPYTYLLRCHRAYIVNKSYVKDVRGNSQGFQLSLNHIEEEIPVSRSYVKILKENL